MAPRGGKKGVTGRSKRNDLEVRGTLRAKFDHKKIKPKKKSNRATVEDVDGFGSELDEIFPLHGRLAQTARTQGNRNRAHELLGILERTAAALAAIGGPEEVEALFQSSGIDDDERIGKIRKSCLDIVSLLPVTKSVDGFSHNEVPSTMVLYDQSFVYRASSSVVYLLRAVDVFKGNKRYTRGKVFGYVRAKGSMAALMSALPGWKKCVEDHARLLDSELWTEVVKPLVNFHNYTFTTGSYDAHHGRENGDGYATHVEPKLMMWFAIYELQKRTGKVRSPLEQRGDIWQLKDLIREEKVEAEIVLSRAPCPHCLKFQQWFERYQPIKFSFIVCTNLGEVKTKKDKWGQVSVPLYADEVESSSDSETESESDAELPMDLQPEPEHEVMDKRPQVKKQSNLAVVIRQKPTPRVAQPASTPRTKLVVPTPAEFSVSTRVAQNPGPRVSITTHLRYSTPPETTRRRRRDYYDSSDEEDWTPSARRRSRVGEDSVATTKSRPAVLPTPNSAPFASDAVHRARHFKKKRESNYEIENSPLAKKARLGKR